MNGDAVDLLSTVFLLGVWLIISWVEKIDAFLASFGEMIFSYWKNGYIFGEKLVNSRDISYLSAMFPIYPRLFRDIRDYFDISAIISIYPR